ncbi:hypothetical protein D3C84_659980 [compost metagenome]
MGIEIARHAPEVPDRRLGFRGNEVDHDARGLVLRLGVVTALAGVGHPHLDQHVAGWTEAADLPAVHRHVVGQVVATQGHAPERRRHDVFHVPRGDHLVTLDGGDRRRFIDLFLADARGVHVGFVGEVHQVIDHQPIVAIDVEQPAAVGPLLADRPFQMMDQRRVSLVLLPGPDPDETVTLFNGVGLVARKTPYALPRHFDGLAVTAHDQAVVTTDQVAVFNIAQ